MARFAALSALTVGLGPIALPGWLLHRGTPVRWRIQLAPELLAMWVAWSWLRG